MKSPPTVVVDDCDDIFGPPRTYPTGYSPPKTRPSMISAKYRQKEERRKVLKISMNKLKKIEDPEASLRRSVLINNTMKRLQREARDEKIQKQQLNYPRCYDNDNILNIKNEFMKNENNKLVNNYDDDVDEPHDFTTNDDTKLIDDDDDNMKVDFVVENDFDTKLAEEINAVTAKNAEVLNCLTLDNTYTSNNNNNNNNINTTLLSNGISTQSPCSPSSSSPSSMTTTTTVSTICSNSIKTTMLSDDDDDHCGNDRYATRKRSFDDMEDCDVQDVLSQFYMPPTPRMLTCIDDDEDVNVVDNEPCHHNQNVKRMKIDDDLDDLVIDTSVNQNSATLSISTSLLSTQNNKNDFCSDNLLTSSLIDKCATSSLTTTTDKTDDFSVSFMNNNNNNINNNNIPGDARLRFPSQETDSNYSCGHASMFNELQSNVYHNLIASLET